MKTIKTFVLVSILTVGMTTSVFASWWNPFTWGFFKKYIQIQQVTTQHSTTTLEVKTPLVSNAIYNDPSGDFSFEHNLEWVVVPSKGIEFFANDGTSTTDVVKGSVEIAKNITLTKVPFNEISKDKPFITYSSCCTFTKYWYDNTVNTWKAEDGKSVQDEQTGALSSKTQNKAITLKNKEGKCTITEKVGQITYQKLIGSDEDQPNFYYYYFITDKGYMIRVDSLIDISKNYSEDVSEDKPKQKDIDDLVKILSSLKLNNSVKELVANCL